MCLSRVALAGEQGPGAGSVAFSVCSSFNCFSDAIESQGRKNASQQSVFLRPDAAYGLSP